MVMLSFSKTICLRISIWTNLLICLTWSQLFDAALAGAGIDREEVLEPRDLRVGDATGSAQHGGCPCPLHHLQLGTHVYAGEAEWQQVFWRDGDRKRVQRSEHHLKLTVKSRTALAAPLVLLKRCWKRSELLILCFGANPLGQEWTLYFFGQFTQTAGSSIAPERALSCFASVIFFCVVKHKISSHTP